MNAQSLIHCLRFHSSLGWDEDEDEERSCKPTQVFSLVADQACAHAEFCTGRHDAAKLDVPVMKDVRGER